MLRKGNAQSWLDFGGSSLKFLSKRYTPLGPPPSSGCTDGHCIWTIYMIRQAGQAWHRASATSTCTHPSTTPRCAIQRCHTAHSHFTLINPHYSSRWHGLEEWCVGVILVHAPCAPWLILVKRRLNSKKKKKGQNSTHMMLTFCSGAWPAREPMTILLGNESCELVCIYFFHTSDCWLDVQRMLLTPGRIHFKIRAE